MRVERGSDLLAGALVALALCAIGASGWVLALFAVAAGAVPWTRGPRWLGLRENAVAAVRWLAVAVLLHTVALGISGGTGLWTLFPAVAAPWLIVSSTVLSLAVVMSFYGFMLVIPLQSVRGATQ